MTDKEISLKILSERHVSEAYLSWMEDPDVLAYLECRWSSYTLEGLREYVAKVNQSSEDVLLGIFVEQDTHIGNVKIGGINWYHRFGDMGLLIGEHTFRGRGLGTRAIELAARYAFEELNLHKVTAGIYAPNTASHRAFLKAGFREVGILKEHRFFRGTYVDEILVEKIR